MSKMELSIKKNYKKEQNRSTRMSMEAPFVVAKAPSVVQGVSTWHSRHTVEDFTARVMTYSVLQLRATGCLSLTHGVLSLTQSVDCMIPLISKYKNRYKSG